MPSSGILTRGECRPDIARGHVLFREPKWVLFFGCILIQGIARPFRGRVKTIVYRLISFVLVNWRLIWFFILFSKAKDQQKTIRRLLINYSIRSLWLVKVTLCWFFYSVSQITSITPYHEWRARVTPAAYHDWTQLVQKKPLVKGTQEWEFFWLRFWFLYFL